MTELTPEEIEELIALEAELAEKEEYKKRLLEELSYLPADDPIWPDIERLIKKYWG